MKSAMNIRRLLPIFCLTIVMSFVPKLVLALAPIDRVVQINTNASEGLEFRTTGTLLVQKTATAGEYILTGTLPANANTAYSFLSGNSVTLTQVSNGVKVKLTGQTKGTVSLAPSSRGMVLRWTPINAKPDEPVVSAAKSNDPKEPKSKKVSATDSLSVTMQAQHFINLLHNIQPTGMKETILDQGREALQKRNFGQAIKIFTEASKDSGLETQALMLLAQTYQLKGEKKNYEKTWAQYLEAAKRSYSGSGKDTLISLLNFHPPVMSSLPPLELPEGMKGLKVPGQEELPPPDTVQKTHSQGSVVSENGSDSVENRTSFTPSSKTDAAHSEVNSQETANIHYLDSLKKIAESHSGFPWMIVVITAVVSLLISFAGFYFWTQRKPKQAAETSIETSPETPRAVPSFLAPQENPETVKQPAVPSGMANVASSYSANSKLSSDNKTGANETAAGLSEEDEAEEEAELESDGKRQMIYELEASGLSIREIAQKMGIGQDEVRTFLSLRKV